MKQIIDFISPSATSQKILNLFTLGIPHNYHTGSQFSPRKQKNMTIIQKAFIVHSCLEDFENGFLLGPFHHELSFVIWKHQATKLFKTQRLKYVPQFTVPKAKRNQTVGRKVFDCKITGYNAGIPDEEGYTKLPQFLEVITLLKKKKWASVIDLKNAYRQ